MNPRTGHVVWNKRLGRGGLLGGIHFGLAVHPELNLVYAPLSDICTDPRLDGIEARPGIHALDMDSGEVVWTAIREPECEDRWCWPGISVAITVTSDLVFAGGIDGTLLAYRAASGEVLWQRNTNDQSWDAVNRGEVHGGSYDAHGVMVADSKLFVSSGYGSFFQSGGNAFLVFEIDDE